MKMTFAAPCLFGLESILAGEVRRMGGEDVTVTDGRVTFTGDWTMLARANLTLRTAERVQILLGEFEARTFTELFDGVKKLPLEEFIGRQDAFPVKGPSVHSALYSIPDCQKIIKKAAVDRLGEVYGVSWFEETGPVHQLQFTILRDRVSLMLDTSGPGLHKRGYRRNAGGAPIKETLAAGMIDLAFVKPDTVFCDPFCGSGTLVIEAAMKALNVPAGLHRTFAAQKWDCVPAEVWRQERTRGLDLIRRDATFTAYGSDLDGNILEVALDNARKAGVPRRVHLRQADIDQFQPPEGAVVVTNPPYGERLLDQQQAREILTRMGKVFQPGKAAYHVISPDQELERWFGRRADKRRKLYNGMLRCQLYSWIPPRRR